MLLFLNGSIKLWFFASFQLRTSSKTSLHCWIHLHDHSSDEQNKNCTPIRPKQFPTNKCRDESQICLIIGNTFDFHEKILYLVVKIIQYQIVIHHAKSDWNRKFFVCVSSSQHLCCSIQDDRKLLLRNNRTRNEDFSIIMQWKFQLTGLEKVACCLRKYQFINQIVPENPYWT